MKILNKVTNEMEQSQIDNT